MATLKGNFIVAIPKTAYLLPPDLECNWEVQFDGDPAYEKVLAEYYRAHYEKEIKAAVTRQAKAFAVPLQSMQKDIDTAIKWQTKVQEASDMEEVIKAAEAFAKLPVYDLNKLVDQYQDYLVKAVENVRAQQLEVLSAHFAAKAIKAAEKDLKTEIRNKKIRHIAGITLRSTLAVGGAAGTLAAFIATMGAAAPVFAALTVIGGSLGLGTALINLGRSIHDVRDLERRSMDLLVKDVVAIGKQFEGTNGVAKGMNKHINDVSMYYTQRSQKTKQLQAKLEEMRTHMGQGANALVQLEPLSPKAARKAASVMKKNNETLTKAQDMVDASLKREADLMKAMTDATVFVKALDHVCGRGMKSMFEGITRLNPKDAAVWTQIIDMVAGVVRVVGVDAKTFAPR